MLIHCIWQQSNQNSSIWTISGLQECKKVFHTKSDIFQSTGKFAGKAKILSHYPLSKISLWFSLVFKKPDGAHLLLILNNVFLDFVFLYENLTAYIPLSRYLIDLLAFLSQKELLFHAEFQYLLKEIS